MDIEREIDKLGYGTIEGIIADHFDIGFPSSSNFPIEFPEETYGTYTLIGSKGNGKFSIRITKKTNGKYELMVSLIGKLSRKK